jgi:hypothetical protein
MLAEAQQWPEFIILSPDVLLVETPWLWQLQSVCFLFNGDHVLVHYQVRKSQIAI